MLVRDARKVWKQHRKDMVLAVLLAPETARLLPFARLFGKGWEDGVRGA